MSGVKFEDQIVTWLKLRGYDNVKKTEYFDMGIDITARKDGKMFGVQVKRASRPVGVASVRAAVSALKSYGCDQAMVVTNASFTFRAKNLAHANSCILVNGADILTSIQSV